MRQKKIFYQIFIIFTITSILVLVVSKTTPFQFVQGFIEKVTVPLQKTFYTTFHMQYENIPDELKRLRDENKELQSKLLAKNLLEKDNQALRDQFEMKDITSTTLLPASIIGTNVIIPGDEPTQLTIDKGEDQGIKKGMTVTYKSFLLGLVTRTSKELSIVTLITDEKTSLTAKTLQTNALGIIKGKENDMLMDQVLLSEKLSVNDTVISRGDVKEDGTGYRKDLLVGKITAVQKKPSSLFQTARVKPLIKFSDLRMVFVIVR